MRVRYADDADEFFGGWGGSKAGEEVEDCCCEVEDGGFEEEFLLGWMGAGYNHCEKFVSE